MNRLRIKSNETSAKFLFDRYSLSSDSSPSYNHSVIKFYSMKRGNENKDISCSLCDPKMEKAG